MEDKNTPPDSLPDIPGPIMQTDLLRGVIQVFLNYISILSAGVCQADNKTFRVKEKWICRLTVWWKRGKMRVLKKQLSDRSRQAICLRETND